jgi:hypothetical protein
MTVITEEARRVAYCQCGARLAGDSDQELFEAAGRHIAEHHQPLGAQRCGGQGQAHADVRATADRQSGVGAVS